MDLAASVGVLSTQSGGILLLEEETAVANIARMAGARIKELRSALVHAILGLSSSLFCSTKQCVVLIHILWNHAGMG